MHETGLIKGLLHRIEDAAHQAGSDRVAAIDVWLGALSQISAGHFREHFDQETKGTLAEGARLSIEESDDPTHPSAQSVMIRSIELAM
ncbi:MAG: hydrogenase/urease maturation nickel metallochaperone HypA [Acetobacteraceae bacterium]